MVGCQQDVEGPAGDIPVDQLNPEQLRRYKAWKRSRLERGPIREVSCHFFCARDGCVCLLSCPSRPRYGFRVPHDTAMFLITCAAENRRFAESPDTKQ